MHRHMCSRCHEPRRCQRGELCAAPNVVRLGGFLCSVCQMMRHFEDRLPAAPVTPSKKKRDVFAEEA